MGISSKKWEFWAETPEFLVPKPGIWGQIPGSRAPNPAGASLGRDLGNSGNFLGMFGECLGIRGAPGSPWWPQRRRSGGSSRARRRRGPGARGSAGGTLGKNGNSRNPGNSLGIRDPPPFSQPRPLFSRCYSRVFLVFFWPKSTFIQFPPSFSHFFPRSSQVFFPISHSIPTFPIFPPKSHF